MHSQDKIGIFRTTFNSISNSPSTEEGTKPKQLTILRLGNDFFQIRHLKVGKINFDQQLWKGFSIVTPNQTIYPLINTKQATHSYVGK